MKHKLKALTATVMGIVLTISYQAHAQVIGGFGTDDVSSTVERTITYVQNIGIGIISIFIAVNLIKMARDGQDGDRAKGRVFIGIAGIMGLMLLRALVSLAQSLTGSSAFFGF